MRAPVATIEAELEDTALASQLTLLAPAGTPTAIVAELEPAPMLAARLAADVPEHD